MPNRNGRNSNSFRGHVSWNLVSKEIKVSTTEAFKKDLNGRTLVPFCLPKKWKNFKKGLQLAEFQHE